jgi:cytochrome c oxidase assembly factor CtaG
MSPPLSGIDLDPLLLLGMVATALPIADRLRRAHRPVSPWRWVALGTAVALLAGVLLSPIEALAQGYLLTAHLVQVLILMGAAPPLLLLALAPAPARHWPSALRRAGHLLTHPAIAIVGVNAVFFLTHWPAAYDVAATRPWLFDAGLLALLWASIVFWWPIVSPDGRTTLLSSLGKLGYILLATIPQTFAGMALALSPKVLYVVYAGVPRLLGLSLHADQQIAGACLAVLSKVALFTAFSIIFVRVMNPGPESDDGDDGGGPRHEPAPSPPGEPAWYRDLEAGRVSPEPRVRAPQPAARGRLRQPPQPVG